MGEFSMVKAPPSSFSSVSMDLGVIIPMIFVMASFGAMGILYAPFLDDFDYSWLLHFWRGRMFDVKIMKISKYLLNLWHTYGFH
jgi:hypothetical protein